MGSNPTPSAKKYQKKFFIISRDKRKFFYEKNSKFLFYGCKQKNNNNKILQLDLNIPKDFKINDRTFACKGNTKDFIWFSYKDFFRQNLAISDFLAICEKYNWFFIDDFEQNDDYGKDIIRRFIGFIDIAYIEKVKIKFFFNSDDIRSLYTGEELSFLWDRTISRLEEMQNINDK